MNPAATAALENVSSPDLDDAPVEAFHSTKRDLNNVFSGERTPVGEVTEA